MDFKIFQDSRFSIQDVQDFMAFWKTDKKFFNISKGLRGFKIFQDTLKDFREFSRDLVVLTVFLRILITSKN